MTVDEEWRRHVPPPVRGGSGGNGNNNGDNNMREKGKDVKRSSKL